MKLRCSVGMEAEVPMPSWLAPKPKTGDGHLRQGGAGLRGQGLLFPKSKTVVSRLADSWKGHHK